MAAARHYFQPTTIYLHTNAQDGVLRQAKAGLNGLWSKLILEMPGVQVRKAVAPSHARNGQNITIVEHKSDFVRVEAVLKYGGVYMDFDAHPLRDVRVLRHAGFQGIVGRQLGGEVMSGTFMSTKGSKMMQRWAEDMHQVYDGGWTTHSNAVINRVAEKLVAEPGEALIMEREAFGPGSWTPEDCIKLYGLHDDTFNMNLTGTTQRVELGQSQTNPSWAIDWSKNYFLHAFSPSRTGTHIDGFDQITPKYVLERRSNFAIAVYPIARKMFEQRLYNIDDPY
ncbi:hypothetical protein QQS21_011250 [Conoideocrella luteorostrata]|uniref:Glycosyltransferase n=1 Tax=Conoideocrella luteorostrata TaxID=1105319 RepID=A0AAJ0CDL0_9HYPO|nr:hypothetical protein QQS21_011250 [Conoideocrella luteorostrata]